MLLQQILESLFHSLLHLEAEMLTRTKFGQSRSSGQAQGFWPSLGVLVKPRERIARSNQKQSTHINVPLLLVQNNRICYFVQIRKHSSQPPQGSWDQHLSLLIKFMTPGDLNPDHKRKQADFVLEKGRRKRKLEDGAIRKPILRKWKWK